MEDAAETALSTPAELSISPPSDEVVQVLERQVGHRLSNVVGVGCRCRWGHPQALAWDPLARHGHGERRVPIDSGLFRLSCPMLVKAIDEWESEGAVVALNAEVALNDTSSLRREDLITANIAHATARREIAGERLELLLANETQGSHTEKLIRMVASSGIAGQTPHKADVKCLHAQMADHLCRSRSNAVGARIERGLEARGVRLDGDDRCWQQCDLAVPEAESTWWYTPVKNRWKLRKQKERRRAQRAAQGSEQHANSHGDDAEHPEGHQRE